MIIGVEAMAGGGEFVEIIAGDAYDDWCDRCMTSSAVIVRFYVLREDGPHWVGLGWACQLCDPERFASVEGDDGDAAVPVG